MPMRDPKVDPKVGDVLRHPTRGERTVVDVRGANGRVVVDTLKTKNRYPVWLEGWRKFAETAEVIKRGDE